MNIKKTAVIFLITIILITVILIFNQKLARESAKHISLPAPAEGRGGDITEPTLNYTVPVNTVPGVQEIEENIKKAEKRRERLGEIRTDIENEKRKDVAELPKPEARPDKETAALPSREAVIVPTKEESENIRSKGIIID